MEDLVEGVNHSPSHSTGQTLMSDRTPSAGRGWGTLHSCGLVGVGGFRAVVDQEYTYDQKLFDPI